MSLIVVAVGCLIIAMGVAGVVVPARLIDWVMAVQTRAGLYTVAGIRVILGIAMWIASADSKAPRTLAVLGVLVILVGIATPLVGLDRSRSLVKMWSGFGTGVVRVWALFAVAGGAALVYVVLP
jgi:hypothetical protein